MVMVSDEIHKYKIPTSYLHLINWLIGMVGIENFNTYIKEVIYNSNSNLISSVFSQKSNVTNIICKPRSTTGERSIIKEGGVVFIA